ncbi:MAG: fimbrillin family protein [Bacteroidales bacterium]|nr:fimbrillin family protein [Bacteroidales bacterium]
MKKIVLLAVISLAALASCTKNEPAPSVTDQQEITFASPVVSLNTKALLEGTLFPTTQTFNVWAWYSEKEYYDGTDGKKYMTDVKVEYNSKDFNDQETADNGAWAPTPTYYWPKDGKLTFDAYSPTGLAGVSCDMSKGLTITDYVVPQDLAAQVDVLYSTRSHDNTSSSLKYNNTYEGVDLVFNHALSAIEFTVQQSANYPAGTIKVKSITVVDAFSKGTFNQNVKYSPTKEETPEWDPVSEPKEFVILGQADYDTSIQPANAPGSIGSTCIVLPQEFNDDVKIIVKYYIKNNNEEPLEQTAEFKLKEIDHQADGVNQWEMGKKYTYNLNIGLQDIFFAPSIMGWDGVTVNLPEIK